MADDFFADLLPLKPKKAEQGRQPDSRAANSASVSPGASSAGATASSFQEVGDLLGSEPRHEIPADFSESKPLEKEPILADNGDQAAVVEKVVHAALHKFANALQPILASMTRQMDELGSKVDQITSTLHASQTSSKQNDAILEHLSSLHSGLKDLQKSVQLVSERQEAADEASHARAAEQQKKVEEPPEPVPAVPPASPKPAVAQLPSPAASLNSNPSAVLPPGPALPLPTVPPLPATAPPATPVEPAAQAQPQPPVPVEAAQNLQRYGSTASSASQPGSFAFAPPSQQPRVQEPQTPQTPFVSAPQQQQPAQFSPAPPAGSQPGFPAGQQQQSLAPQTPPYGAPAQQTPHGPPGQQYSGPQHQAPPRPQYSSPSPYAGWKEPGSYQQGQQPSRQYYTSGPPQASSGFNSQETSPYSGSYGGPSTSQGYQSSSGSSYPGAANPAPPSRYGQGGYGHPPCPLSSQSYIGSRPEPQRQSSQTSPQSVPLEKVVDDIANMGFSRHEARAVIQELQDKGQAVDLNVVLDRLMNGPRG